MKFDSLIGGYSPSFERGSVQQQDADEYLKSLVETPCGSDGLTFSSKSNNSSAKSLAHAGKMIPSSLVRSQNELNKAEAFATRFPDEADLVGFDEAIDAKYKDFKDFNKSNEVVEAVNLVRGVKMISLELRNKTAKHVASIGGYSAYLTDDVAEKFAQFAFNYWVSKNPELRAIIASKAG